MVFLFIDGKRVKIVGLLVLGTSYVDRMVVLFVLLLFEIGAGLLELGVLFGVSCTVSKENYLNNKFAETTVW